MPHDLSHEDIKYVIYAAGTVPRDHADWREAAWDDRMRNMYYRYMSDAYASALKRHKQTGGHFTVYPHHSAEPIASTAQWAVIDKMEWIHE